MARIGHKPRRLKELEGIAQEFAAAMVTADAEYISLRGVFTPRMIEIWLRYIDWCDNEKV